MHRRITCTRISIFPIGGLRCSVNPCYKNYKSQLSGHVQVEDTAGKSCSAHSSNTSNHGDHSCIQACLLEAIFHSVSSKIVRNVQIRWTKPSGSCLRRPYTARSLARRCHIECVAKIRRHWSKRMPKCSYSDSRHIHIFQFSGSVGLSRSRIRLLLFERTSQDHVLQRRQRTKTRRMRAKLPMTHSQGRICGTKNGIGSWS